MNCIKMRFMVETERCEECEASIGWREGVHLGSGDGGKSRHLCARCANLALAEMVGLDFDHPDFTPMTLEDAGGLRHHFKFVTHLVPSGITITAVEEDKESGYEFQVHGEFDDDTMALFRELLDRMRRDLARRHLDQGEGGSWGIGDDGVVRARIDSNPESEDRVPLLVIDGRPVSWMELGEMLMTFEGWQFKLEIYDLSEEIGDDTVDRSRFLMRGDR